MQAYIEQHDNHFQAFLARNLNFPLHLHPQLELLLVLSGESTVTIRSQTRTLTAGSFAIFFPNQIHSFTTTDPDTVVALVICNLSYTGRYSRQLLANYPENPFFTSKQLHPNVNLAIQELLEEQETHENSLINAPFIQIFLARVMPQLILHRNRSTDHEDLTYQIAGYISEHFRENLSLDDMARALGLSKYHLSHIFSDKIGQSFPSYLSSIRLSHACGMLLETNFSITYIAEESGFKSQRSFYRIFREQLGISPMLYRQRALHVTK